MKTLPKTLKNRPFTYKEAVECGLTQHIIRQLLAAESIERIERGVYQTVAVDLSDEELFRRAVKKMDKPSAVCLLSALSYYQVTDIIPDRVWLMVEADKRTSSPNIRLYRAREPKWKIGVVIEDGFSITSLERSIVDALTHKSLIPVRIGLDALKKAVSTKKTSTTKIIEVARSLGVMHRILPYIEALS